MDFSKPLDWAGITTKKKEKKAAKDDVFRVYFNALTVAEPAHGVARTTRRGGGCCLAL